MQDRGSRHETYVPDCLFARCLSNVVKNGLSFFLFFFFFSSSRSLSFLAWAANVVSTWHVGVNAWEVLQGYEARSSGTIGKSSIGYCSDLSIGFYCII